ncbi:hypothetical protein ABZ619_43040 [Streptomyces sp. NPDC007851]|uniref:hypothetical protein n=1 Tax=Streptomyces sp. NPDC007851 TaxID=3155008 RepID=UPI0033C3C9DA
MASAGPLPEVRPPEEDDEGEALGELLDGRVDLELDEDEPPVPEPELLDVVPVVPLAVVSASACVEPTRANTPAAAASVTAAARAAVRRVPRRTAAAAPRSPSRSPCWLCSPGHDRSPPT